MASAAEEEIASLFLNARLTIPLRTALIKMGHPQPATKINTDKNTDNGFVNGTVKQNKTKQKKTKAVEMRFDWLKCKLAQLQFNIYWAPGTEKCCNFFHKKITQPLTT